MIVYQKDGKDYLLMTNSSRGVMKIPTEGAGTAESITKPVPGGGTQGPRLRHDRQPQGRRPDGSARRSPCRDPDPGQGHRDGRPLHHRTAVTFRPYLLLLAACGAFPLLEGIVPARPASPSADDRPAPAEGRPTQDSPGLRWTSHKADGTDASVEVIGIDRKALAALAKSGMTRERWTSCLAVRVVTDHPGEGDRHATPAGHLSVDRRRHPVRAPIPPRAGPSLPGRARTGSTA